MDRATRRQLALLLVGVLSTVGALSGLELLRERRCTGAGGRWDSGTHECLVSADAGYTPFLPGPVGYVLAAVAAAVLGFMLWRLFTFASSRTR